MAEQTPPRQSAAAGPGFILFLAVRTTTFERTRGNDHIAVEVDDDSLIEATQDGVLIAAPSAARPLDLKVADGLEDSRVKSTPTVAGSTLARLENIGNATEVMALCFHDLVTIQ